ncbi:PREDICTED: uncharacterized protein LOC105533467 [Mandrillus leucophaeus]|uniref:uncharacterized protein LOC105533467 n=1 Tax=Mandrillus leucophaeus TaxID=9568 RepID=UPI0005F386AA|nr:PREDICTED: uncharacterized protein LOC105533467 [Mandrillus leucophaeus]
MENKLVGKEDALSLRFELPPQGGKSQAPLSPNVWFSGFRDPLQRLKGSVYCVPTLFGRKGVNPCLPADSERNLMLQKRALWEQRRGSFLLEGGSAGPWRLEGRTWSFSWPSRLFLKPPIGVEDDAWGMMKMPGKEDRKDFLWNGPSQYDPSMGTWPGAQKVLRGPYLAGRASAKQVDKELQPTRSRSAGVLPLRRARQIKADFTGKVVSGRPGLVPVPETNAARRAALGTQGWDPRLTRGQRPPLAPRGRPALEVRPELQLSPRGDLLLGHNLGSTSARGPSRSNRENEKEIRSALDTKEDPRDVHPQAKNSKDQNGLWGAVAR